jgi:hypothetical protein
VHLYDDDTDNAEWLVLYKANVPDFLYKLKQEGWKWASEGLPWNRKDAKDILSKDYQRLVGQTYII